VLLAEVVLSTVKAFQEDMCQQVQGDTKKRELLKTPTKIEEIQTCKTFLWR
jgi:hypothetical protein